MPNPGTTPRCFISYSWDNDTHRKWVKDLASKLTGHGIDVRLDRWHAIPGDQLPQFMETEIRESDFVLIVCTPRYKNKSDNREGGTGYEGDIITGELFVKKQVGKFIPVLKSGQWEDAGPSFLLGKYYIDLSAEPYSEDNYNDLLSALLGIREEAPQLGVPPLEY